VGIKKKDPKKLIYSENVTSVRSNNIKNKKKGRQYIRRPKPMLPLLLLLVS
jgi:hypothetical protein